MPHSHECARHAHLGGISMGRESRRLELRLLDLFSGVGGIPLGFGWAGASTRYRVRPVLMVDSDAEARETAIRNMPDVPFRRADLHGLSGQQIREHAGLAPDDTIHLLVGGPPCQGLSYA